TITSVSGASSSSIVLHIDVASDATGTRDLVVTNTSDGGTTTKTAALTIDPAPAPTEVSPQYMARGGTATITIDGGGFDSGATPSFGHIDLTGVAVNGANTQITAQGTADDALTVGRGPQSLLNVTNGDGGVGTCACTITLADPPGAPSPGTVIAADGTLSLPFSAPSDDGGAGPPS